MTFAKVVFALAGVWGIVVLTPLFFLVDITGTPYAPPSSYPHFFYGFFAVAMAWQLAFLIIASNPARYRLLMLPAVVEKLGFVATVAVLRGQGLVTMEEASVAVPDLVLAVLFLAAFVRTPADPAA
jgi:hypothetical protein